MGRKKIYQSVVISLLYLFVIGCASSNQSNDKALDKEIDQEFEQAATDGGESDDNLSEDQSGFDDGGESAENEDELEDGLADEDFAEEQELAEEPEAPAEQKAQPEEALPQEPKVVETPPPAPLPESQQSLAPEVEVNNISFLANDFGGTVLIETDGKSVFTTRKNEANQQVVVEITNAKLPNRLRRPYITKDFKGDFASINAYQTPGSTTARIIIQMKDQNLPDVLADGNSILVLPKGVDPTNVTQISTQGGQPPVQYTEGDRQSYDTDQAKKDQNILRAQSLDEFLLSSNKFYGRRISIETAKDADVRDVINTIAEQSGMNIVLSEDVNGTIQIKLRDVPWDQALVIILRAKKLGYIRQGNVLRISTLSALHDEATSAKQVLESRQTISPLLVKVLPISFADVKEIKKHAELFITKGRGSISADERTNSIIIKDTQDQLNKITMLVKELDIPPLQVMIEGKFIEATKNFLNTFGMSWNMTGHQKQISSNGGANGLPLSYQPSFAFQSDARATGRIGLEIRTLDVLGNLSATLSLEESKNNIKVISAPRVITMNREKAEIEQSGEILRKKTTQTEAGSPPTVTSEAVKYSLKMSVVPQVTSNGNVIMEVDVKREFPGLAEADSGERGIESRQAKTKTMVKNGQTAVIGGIFQEDESQSELGIPGLMDLPFIGWMFKVERGGKLKTELLVFLTPRIIEEDNIEPLDLSNTLGTKIPAEGSAASVEPTHAVNSTPKEPPSMEEGPSEDQNETGFEGEDDWEEE